MLLCSIGNLSNLWLEHSSILSPIRLDASQTQDMLSFASMRDDLTINDLQELIQKRYFETDSQRGIAKTFLWLTEEIGELAHALGRYERGDPDLENLNEEFADVLAWLTTLANITDIDLTKAILDKYVKDGGPEGTK